MNIKFLRLLIDRFWTMLIALVLSTGLAACASTPTTKTTEKPMVSTAGVRSSTSPNQLADGNYSAHIAGSCSILTFSGGKPTRYVSKKGCNGRTVYQDSSPELQGNRIDIDAARLINIEFKLDSAGEVVMIEGDWRYLSYSQDNVRFTRI